MKPELNKQNEQALQNTIGNMLLKADLRPEGTESLFDRLEKSSEQAAGVEQAIAQTRQSMGQLMDQRSKFMGAIDTLTDLIAEGLTDEQVALHGDKINQPTQLPKDTKKDELPIEEPAQG